MTERQAPSELDAIQAALGEEYEIVEELGRGGMAVVYRARERALDRDVAIKVLPFSLSFDADIVERFQREARTAAQLEHPHIVPIYRVGRSGHVAYFVMQCLRGRSLSAVLAERGRLSVAEIRRMLAEVGAALGYAASRGVVHRDIKPDNILLDERGRCVVTDFGIAKTGAHQRLTATGMSIGTPRYMSPEQARAKATDGRSDIYSLGIVAYECLAGRVPFDADDAVAILMDHVQRPLPRPALAGADERALFAVVERMLAKRPEDRFADADALLAALGAAHPAGSGDPGSFAEPVSVADGALDRALGRAIDAARPVAAAVRPRARAMLEGARDIAGRGAPHVGRALGRAGSRGLEGLDWIRSRGPRTWRAAVAGAALLVAGYWGVHFAVMHRSRCPETAAGQGDAAGFTLLVDEIGRHRGGEVELYFDVCGLTEQTPFSTHVSVSRQGSALRRLFGGAAPARESFHDSADGPRTRRHRDIDAGELEPGSYSVVVVVTDDRERRRERSVQFEVR